MREVVLGMGGCVDYEVAWDASVVSRLAIEFGVTSEDLHNTGPVHGEREVLAALVTHMTKGTGGERFVEDQEALLRFAGRFRTNLSLGGSSVRAAVALDRLGVRTLLHLVSIDGHVTRLLPPSSRYVCSAQQESTDPHVILQYPSGARVRITDREIVAPRPNRLILVNDPPNQVLRIDPRFGDAVTEAKVVVVSGFNTMLTADAARQRTREVANHLRRRPKDCVVIYEDAGFHNDQHRAVVMATMRDSVDIWSMNEDEAQYYLSRRLDLTDAHDVSQAVIDLHALVGVPTLVLHTSKWALAYGGGNLREALQSGVLTATARYVVGDSWEPRQVDSITSLPPDPSLAELTIRVERLLGAGAAMVPIPSVHVLNPTTVGLGDTFLGGLIAGLVRA